MYSAYNGGESAGNVIVALGSGLVQSQSHALLSMRRYTLSIRLLHFQLSLRFCPLMERDDSQTEGAFSKTISASAETFTVSRLYM